MKVVAEQLKGMIRHMNPANVFFELAEEKLGERALCWFNYKTYAIDEQVYVVVYFCPLGKNRLLHGTFSCKFDDMNEWNEAAKQAIMSINPLSESEGAQ